MGSHLGGAGVVVAGVSLGRWDRHLGGPGLWPSLQGKALLVSKAPPTTFLLCPMSQPLACSSAPLGLGARGGKSARSALSPATSNPLSWLHWPACCSVNAPAVPPPSCNLEPPGLPRILGCRLTPCSSRLLGVILLPQELPHRSCGLLPCVPSTALPRTCPGAGRSCPHC